MLDPDYTGVEYISGWYGIALISIYLFITCMIAIDLPEAVSGGVAAAKCSCANMIHHATQTYLIENNMIYDFECRYSFLWLIR